MGLSWCEAGSRSGEQMSWIWPVSHILTSLVMGSSSSVQPRAEQDRISLLLSGEFRKTKLWICVNKHEAVQFTETVLNKEDFPGFYVAALLQDTAPLNKYDQLYKLSLIAYMFEAEPRHLLAHVTTLTPLLICNCPQPVRNTTLGSG